MSRARRELRSPIERMAIAVDGLRYLVGALDTFETSEREIIIQLYGLRDEEPRTPDELCRTYGVDPERIRRIEGKLRAKFWHPARSRALDDLQGEDFRSIPTHFRQQIVGTPAAASGPLLFCPRHGWFDVTERVTICGRCPCPVSSQTAGRPRRYCSDACRQSGYRNRKTRRNTLTSRAGAIDPPAA